jgi:dGTP triphosphohydrolase
MLKSIAVVLLGAGFWFVFPTFAFCANGEPSVCIGRLLNRRTWEHLGIASSLGRSVAIYQAQETLIRETPDFRKLNGLYQLALNYEDPSLTHRLRHTETVADIARVLARGLGLSEASQALVSVLGLGHDIGHPIFSHEGQYAIGERLKPFGFSWSHDTAGLRALNGWSDLPNYLFAAETVEGLAKHGWKYDPALPISRTNHSRLELPPAVLNRSDLAELHLGEWNHLEGQIAMLADKIAYNTSDVVDGLRIGKIELVALQQNFPFAYGVYREVLTEIAEQTRVSHAPPASLEKTIAVIESNPMLQDYVFRMMEPRLRAAYINDVLATTLENIERAVQKSGLSSAAAVRTQESLLVAFSPELMAEIHSFGKYCMASVFPQTAPGLTTLVHATIDLLLSGQVSMRGLYGQRLMLASTEADRLFVVAEYLTREMTDMDALNAVREHLPATFQTSFPGYDSVRAPSASMEEFEVSVKCLLAL